MLEGLLTSKHRAAKLVLTVELSGAKTYHQTFALKHWQAREGDEMITVEVKGSGDWESGVRPIKIYHVNVTRGSARDARDDRNQDAMLRYAARAALRFAWTGLVPTPANGSVSVIDEDVCSCCGAELTDPISIERGMGPECYGKATGAKTITGRKLSRSTVTPEVGP